jgi:hypothetical protein
VSLNRATPLATLAGLIAGIALLLAYAPAARAGQAPLSAGPLDGYIAGVARAWEPYTTADGRVEDPLKAADTGDNYGVILLADVMLKVARRTGDVALEAAGARIIASALSLPVPNDPFNLLAIAAVIHDGEQGDFPVGAWEGLAAPLIQRAGEIGPPVEASCLTEPLCYDNWRLVWAAGAALLLSDHVTGIPGSAAREASATATQISDDLKLAVTHAGAPLAMKIANQQAPVTGRREPAALHGQAALHEQSAVHEQAAAHEQTGMFTSPAAGGAARELSDPGAEPPAYELFSTFMLELVGELDPQAITPAVARLRRQADRYALDMMAPDGQLSLSGRSLDQSWVQAAAAALGARRALLEPSDAAVWRAYADRAASYLLSAYPLRADGLLPIVPGLSVEWNPSIMDGYAALNQYEGLTLWLLSDALAKWPQVEATRAPLPADSRELAADDLGSSGLVWGRSGSVWWELSGRSTSSDPRSAQGLVAVKVKRAGAWRDLLALRPRQHGPSSVWTLVTARGRTVTPTFTQVRGDGRRVVLSGGYRQRGGHLLGRTTWTLATTATGVRLSMSMPAKSVLHTTVWLPNAGSRLSAPGASFSRGECVVSASGRACPTTIYWHDRRAAVLEVRAPSSGPEPARIP